MMNEMHFRKRLERITTDRSADLWLADIAKLRYPHAICAADTQHNRMHNFNCFAVALGLTSSRSYQFIRTSNKGRDLNVFANTKFVRWLLDGGWLKPIRRLDKSESIVVYFDGDKPRHAGRFNDGRVLSKWGTGFSFQHGTFEVPANYGNSIECYSVPAVQVVEDSFLKFAASEGVPVNDLVSHWNL